MSEVTTRVSSWTIGVDLGDRFSQVCVLDAAGEVAAGFRVATTAKGFDRGLSRYRGARVVLEVGTHSPWVSHGLEDLGYEVIVANPRKLRSITHNDRKDDRTDAEQLARLGRVDPKLLSPIRHRGLSAQRERTRLAVRDGLVRARVLLVNQARGLAKPLGLRLPKCTTEGFARRMRRDDRTEAFPGMASLVAMVEQLTVQIAALEKQVEAVSEERYPETARLRQVPGVGPLTALAYVLTIEDPQRFRCSRSVGAYLGLRPRRRQSGDQDPMLRITKAGDPYLRRLLVQCAHHILGPFGPDTDLRRFGLRLMARGGRAGRKKALVAVARKLAVLLHRLWVTGETYEPLRAVAAQTAAA